ncbi:unnamed protein product [Candidula unifasciata]|uniref:StAR-related lipid transfer protein 3 n=1 Tax=Candidula unifasciata TaxID=100452 RepID=A0A8S3YJE5_9EUPU|nr:unnamed protein product [Candidula unifasciata]
MSAEVSGIAPSIMSVNTDVAVLQSSREEQATYAGQVIYKSLHPEVDTMNPPALLGSESSTAPLLLPTDSALELSGMAEGRMSSVRRTFCLFVLFDLILMFILWVIYTQLIGDTGFTAFEKQVEKYDFRTSLFDTVMLSAVRFTLLILAYALFRIRHWWMIAISTALSCSFLIVKIFLFDFGGTKSSNNPLSYCLIIISFVLAWAETWFLDFKVLPHEKKLRERIVNSLGRVYGATLTGPNIQPTRADDLQSVITEDNNQFYSPVDSPEGSDTEQETRSTRSSRSMTRQENDYVKLAKHSWEVLWTYVNSPESDWKLEAGTSEVEGVVHSKKIKGVGKVFRLKAVIDIPPKDLFEEMTFKPEEQPTWNSSIKSCRVLQVVDDHTDILYIVSGDLAGGVITSRDFVSLRTWGIRDGIYVGSGMGVTHPSMPPQKNYVRGENGAGGWVYKPVPGDASRTLFFWYMNTDIKGWFPQKLIDANMAKVHLDFCRDLKLHVKRITGS